MVKDIFGNEIFIGTLVAVATNSGIYVGRVTKFNELSYRPGEIYSVQIERFDGVSGRRKQSYDFPHTRMVNLDKVVQYAEGQGL